MEQVARPRVQILYPQDNEPSAPALLSVINVTFDQSVVKGNGSIIVYSDSDRCVVLPFEASVTLRGSTNQTIDVNDAAVFIPDNSNLVTKRTRVRLTRV